MKKWLGIFMLLTMLTSILSGCTPNTSKTTEESSEKSSMESKPLSSDSNLSASETPKPASDVTKEGTWPRTIVDATGAEIVLEKKPERITLLHIVYLEHFLALGVPPTAAALGNAQGDTESLEASELLWPYLKDVDMTMLGNSKDLSLEAVLESKPDVIVTFHNPSGLEQYEQLAEIAPVIQINYADTWQNQLKLCAEILGMEDKAASIIAEVEQKITETKTVLAPYADRSFALFRTDGKNFMAQSTAKYYELFGLTKPEGFTGNTGTGKLESISVETVSEMNPYYIVFQHNYDVAKAFVDSMKDNSVWQSLEAVKNGRVYYFDENMNSFGPLSIRLGADKITEIYTRQ